MKKFTRILAIILCMAIMFALCACGGTDTEDTEKEIKKTDSELFVGTWEAELDMTDAALEGFKAKLRDYEAELGNADDVMGYFEFGKIVSTVTFTLKEDGTYTMNMAISDESVESYNAAFKKGLKASMYEVCAALAEVLGMSMEEYEAAYLAECGESLDVSLDAAAEQTMAKFDIKTIIADSTLEGKWKAENGKLFMTDSLDGEFADGNYDVYEALTEDGFKLVAGYTDDVEEADGFYPLTFAKAK